MIQVNLLPEGMRRQKKFYLALDLTMARDRFLVGGVLAGILILLFVIPLIGSSLMKKQIARLRLEEQKIAPQKREIEAIAKEISILRSKMAGLDQITKRRFLWAQKLNELSDLILPGIWFTRIRTDSDEKLIIEGSVISKKEEAMASVGKFMKNIKEQGLFFKDFSNIKLETVQRKNIDTRDIVDFRIALYF
jgi:Tfp pilus assembly protein PilN